MRQYLTILAVALGCSGFASGQGLLVPQDRTLPPLPMTEHRVRIALEDQVAVTHVEQTFRNDSARPLEATYVFPVPKGANVNKFTMWVDGKETRGELLEAAKARDIYTMIVRRTSDPGLLEYIGNDLLRLRVFPVPARGNQKVAFEYTAVCPKEGGTVEFVYPLKTDGRSTATLKEFSLGATIKSQHGVSNVYSPTHSVAVNRTNDREVTVSFDRNQGLLDKDFQLFYATGDKDVGLTVLTHRPVASEDGYFTLLISPKVQTSSKYEVPRDMVLVLDTSGSMRGAKMDQARNALKYCLDNLGKNDRFALLNFATTVNTYRDGLSESSPDRVADAKKWVESLEATGGTAIDAALAAALALRGKEEGRTFTVVFFTDGQPTVGETNPEVILKHVSDKNTASTRIFTFGVGDDVNATLLDRLAERTRAIPTYVRPAEDIEAKVSGLYAKISNPVLANLKLTTSDGVSLREIYPPALPDLFHAEQLIVLGRFRGQGHATVRLIGQVGSEAKEFTYDVTFPERTSDERGFVEHLWARRKVGFLLDQIRANGEKKELVDEVVALAKHYGITTPYTSYLIVPDGPMPVIGGAGRGLGIMQHGGAGAIGGGIGVGSGRGGGVAAPAPVAEFARQMNQKPGDLAANRGTHAAKALDQAAEAAKGEKDTHTLGAVAGALSKQSVFASTRSALAHRQQDAVQAGKLGVDLSVQTQNLRNQSRLELTAVRVVNGRRVMEVDGVWIDEGFNGKTPAVVVKAQSDAYFRILDRQPAVKDVYRLGNRVVWVTPAGTALVIDTAEGKETIPDAEIDRLFVAK
jgi:Ca-activated chloride channel family protein